MWNLTWVGQGQERGGRLAHPELLETKGDLGFLWHPHILELILREAQLSHHGLAGLWG